MNIISAFPDSRYNHIVAFMPSCDLEYACDAAEIAAQTILEVRELKVGLEMLIVDVLSVRKLGATSLATLAYFMRNAQAVHLFNAKENPSIVANLLATANVPDIVTAAYYMSEARPESAVVIEGHVEPRSMAGLINDMRRKKSELYSFIDVDQIRAESIPCRDFTLVISDTTLSMLDMNERKEVAEYARHASTVLLVRNGVEGDKIGDMYIYLCAVTILGHNPTIHFSGYGKASDLTGLKPFGEPTYFTRAGMARYRTKILIAAGEALMSGRQIDVSFSAIEAFREG